MGSLLLCYDIMVLAHSCSWVSLISMLPSLQNLILLDLDKGWEAEASGLNVACVSGVFRRPTLHSFEVLSQFAFHCHAYLVLLHRVWRPRQRSVEMKERTGDKRRTDLVCKVVLCEHSFIDHTFSNTGQLLTMLISTFAIVQKCQVGFIS